ncbi:hypothetical protein [Halonatronum saccharophilum]|uniref:hypothetical protein n=1 Tax=Halonatronum saccharophilum TaxID=150060 RepID=UPI001B7FDA79|nr:hypothetical protein [Halonatronum saccharophilum]
MICLVVLAFSQIAFAENTNINTNTNNITVSFGITTPILGGTDDKYINGEKFSTSISEINWTLGYTKRNYFGDGLPSKGGAGYFEYGTMVILLLYIGLGYTYRFNDTFFVSAGIPDFAIGFTF